MIVFAVLGIFSARYRGYAKEAFSCVFRRLTLRPCETNFHHKVKMKVVSKMFRKSPKTARFTLKHFEAISWVFTILLIVSLAYTAYSVYNLAVYGTCDIVNPDGCVFNPEAVGCEIEIDNYSTSSCIDSSCNT
jgi:hypothetical protein